MLFPSPFSEILYPLFLNNYKYQKIIPIPTNVPIALKNRFLSTSNELSQTFGSMESIDAKGWISSYANKEGELPRTNLSIIPDSLRTWTASPAMASMEIARRGDNKRGALLYRYTTRRERERTRRSMRRSIPGENLTRGTVTLKR